MAYFQADGNSDSLADLHSVSKDSPIPTLLAFLLCETVIHDAETQKKTLVGVFDRMGAFGTPVAGVNVGVYAKLVEGNGKYALRIRMVNLRDESQVMEINVGADWQKPEAPLEFGINMRGLVIPAFGDYEFQLFADDIYLGRAVFKVEQMQVPQGLPGRR